MVYCYQERLPPPQEDWLQMCDQDYTVTELNNMQQQLFCALNFDLGAPLSYRFLRRFARVGEKYSYTNEKMNFRN